MGSIIAVVVVLVTLLTKPVMLVDFVPGLQAVVSGAAVGFMLWVAFSGVRRRPLPVIFPVALGITIAGGVSIFYAIDPILGVRQLVSTFPLRPLFFLSMLLWVDSLTRTRLVMRTIVFCGAAFAAHGLLQAASASFGFLSGAGDFGILGRVTANSTGIMSLVDPDAEGLGFVFPRVQSFFSEPAFYMGFLNVCLFLGLSLGLIATRRIDSILCFGGAALIVSVAPLTMSTAGVFSMVVGLVLFGALAYRVTALRTGLRWTVVVGLIALGLGGAVAARTTLGRMVFRFTVIERFSGTSGSVSDRARGFGIADDIIFENPLGGVGFGNEQEAAVPYLGYPSSQYSSHLISFIQMGLPGFLLHLGMTLAVAIAFASAFRHVRRLREEKELLYLMLIGPFVAFVTLTGHGVLIPNAWWYIQWYVYILAYALSWHIYVRFRNQHVGAGGIRPFGLNSLDDVSSHGSIQAPFRQRMKT
ncbi:MAG: hypothetical protein FJ207_07340 [Gemmatimonadetes bacterium]|nr:hypothetical protein [Gemmatimonadota bacterium]